MLFEDLGVAALAKVRQGGSSTQQLARATRPWPGALPLPRWRTLLAEGALAGLLGGWLGALVFGRFYGAPNALWFSAVLLVAGPWLLPRLRAWQRAQRAITSTAPSGTLDAAPTE